MPSEQAIDRAIEILVAKAIEIARRKKEEEKEVESCGQKLEKS